MPDLFFRNEKSVIFTRSFCLMFYLRIFPNGNNITYSLLSKNLQLYPLDSQTAKLTVDEEDLIFLWREGDPVQVTQNLHLPRFTLEKFETKYCNSKTNTENTRV
ncbi:Glycine receptor subunit alpha-3 [Armadillidium vulgare]|nr:Glycine receptor subunit alpha-3 [Armadillidium vulgare]